jgi:hypothetical protein
MMRRAAGFNAHKARVSAWQKTAEPRLRLGRAIGDRKGRDMTGDRLADPLDDRHQGLWPALAVQTDDIGAGGL